MIRKKGNTDVHDILRHAIDWAMDAGRIQREKFRSHNLQMSTKSNISDVVTEVDKACEAMLLDRITSRYPDHNILAEESGEHCVKADSDWEWVVDPLDGTNNYSQGLPIFCVSIGVRFKGETVVGVVYVPYMDELFSAVRGEGANWNGRFIHVSRKTALNECVLGSGFPYDKGTNPVNNVDNASKLIPQLRGFRRMGSAAYDLCCVAAGLLDGYWELDLKPWDACAGALIVEEAGGIIKPFRNDRHVSIVAGNKAIVEQIYEQLNKEEAI